MATFTSKATGEWQATGQTTWNEVGYPQAGDVVVINPTHTVTTTQTEACDGLVINGSLVLGADIQCNGTFALDGTDINTGVYDVIINSGQVLYISGAVTSLNLLLEGICGISWNAATQLITSMTQSSGTLTTSSTTYTKKFRQTSGTFTIGHPVWVQEDGDDWWENLGTVNGDSVIYFKNTGNQENSLRTVIGGTLSLIIISAIPSWIQTLSGELSTPNFQVRGNNSSNTCRCNITSTLANLGDVILGFSTNRNAILDLHNTVKIGSMVKSDVGATVNINLNSCQIESTGKFDGTSTTVTNDANAVHIIGVGGSAELANVSFGSANVFAHECIDGGGNSNVTFNNERYPYQSLLGVA